MNVDTKNTYINFMGEIQSNLDIMTDTIKKEYTPYFDELYKWLEQNNEADLFEHLKLSLAQLPVRSALNILTSFYGLLSIVFYTAVHPVKGSTDLARSALILMNELMKPEVWSKIGTGSLGMILGQSLVMGGPLPLIGLALAGALSVGGISIEAFIAALRSNEGQALQEMKGKLFKPLKMSW